jgi:hypothetical protein
MPHSHDNILLMIFAYPANDGTNCGIPANRSNKFSAIAAQPLRLLRAMLAD